MEDGETIRKNLFSSEVSVEKNRLGSCHTGPLTSPVDVLMRCAMILSQQTDRLEEMQGYRAASLTGFTFLSFPLSPSLPFCILCARTCEVNICLFSACKILVAKEIGKELKRVAKVDRNYKQNHALKV